MATLIALIGLVVAAAPDGETPVSRRMRVAIATDTKELLQCDPLRIQCSITNNSGSDLFLRRHPSLPSFRFIRFEINRNDEWKWLCVVDDIRLRFNKGGDGGTTGRLILNGVSYSECAYAIIDDDGKWVFDLEGSVRIRACVRVGDMDVLSNEIEITVGKRSADVLSHVKSMATLARQLELVSLRRGLPEDFRELRKCGGNLEDLAEKLCELDNYLAERQKGGGKILLIESLDRLRERVDAVTYEVFVNALGREFYEKNDIDGLRVIESRMNMDSELRRIFRYAVRKPSLPHEYTRQDFGGSSEDTVKSD